MAEIEARDIGLDVEKPEDACQDDNCPFHGTLPVRGRVFTGRVVSDMADKTATVRWQFTSHVPKYERYERKNTKVTVHNPPCIDADEGDEVTIAECRPLSKTKKFVVVEKVME